MQENKTQNFENWVNAEIMEKALQILKKSKVALDLEKIVAVEEIENTCDDHDSVNCVEKYVIYLTGGIRVIASITKYGDI